MSHNQLSQERATFTEPIGDFLAQSFPIGRGPHSVILKARLKDPHNENWKSVGENIVVIKKIDLCLENKQNAYLAMIAIGGENVALKYRPKHPNLLYYHGKFMMNVGGKYYFCIVCEYLNGGDLYEISRGSKGFGEEDLCKIVVDVLRGLIYLHNDDLIHRDIKRENMMKDQNGRTKIIDYGYLFKITDALSQPRTMSGTPKYLSPELTLQLLYSNELLSADKINGMAMSYGNKESDIWALGIVALELITGKDVFDVKKTTSGLVSQYKDMMSMSLYNKIDTLPNVTLECKEWLKGLLKNDPKERFTAVEAFEDPWIQRFVQKRRSLQAAQSEAKPGADRSLGLAKPTGSIPTPVPQSKAKVGLAGPTQVTSPPQQENPQSSRARQVTAPSSETRSPQTPKKTVSPSSTVGSNLAPKSTAQNSPQPIESKAVTAPRGNSLTTSVLKRFTNATSRSTSKSVTPTSAVTSASASSTLTKRPKEPRPETPTKGVTGSVASKQPIARNQSNARDSRSITRKATAEGPAKKQETAENSLRKQLTAAGATTKRRTTADSLGGRHVASGSSKRTESPTRQNK